MAAYAVFIREATLNQSELETYATRIRENWATFEAFSPQLLVVSDEHEVIEGGEIEGVVILEFPSVEAARQWYRSPAHQDLVQHRLKGGRFKSGIVAGVDSQVNGVSRAESAY